MTVCVRGHLVQEEMNRESKPVEEILAHMNEVAENHIVAGGVMADMLESEGNQVMQRLQKAMPFASGKPPQLKPEKQSKELEFFAER